MSDLKKVLVVYRQDAVSTDIKKQFDRAGWYVHLAHNGLDGLMAARRESYGLIVCAIDLPVITGIEMVRAVRNFSFNMTTPAVFVDWVGGDVYGDILTKLNAHVIPPENLTISSLLNAADNRSAAKVITLNPQRS